VKNPNQTISKSAVTIERGKKYATDEQTRNHEKLSHLDYLLPREFRQESIFEYTHKENGKPLTEREIFNIKLQELKEQKFARKHTGGKLPTMENSFKEFVVNLNPHHDRDDVKAVMEYLEKKFNIVATSYSIHRDEGYLMNKQDSSITLSAGVDYYTDKQGTAFIIEIDEQGKKRKTDKPLDISQYEPIYNYHAHINFITINQGRQQWRLNNTPKNLREMQTDVAEILGMERGVIGSKAKHKSRKEFIFEKRQMHEAVEREVSQKMEEINEGIELLGHKEVANLFEQIRKNAIGKGLPKEFFSTLSEHKKEAVKQAKICPKSKEQIDEQIKQAIESASKTIFGKPKLESVVANLTTIVTTQNDDIATLALKNDEYNQARIEKMQDEHNEEKYRLRNEKYDQLRKLEKEKDEQISLLKEQIDNTEKTLTQKAQEMTKREVAKEVAKYESALIIKNRKIKELENGITMRDRIIAKLEKWIEKAKSYFSRDQISEIDKSLEPKQIFAPKQPKTQSKGVER